MCAVYGLGLGLAGMCFLPHILEKQGIYLLQLIMVGNVFKVSRTANALSNTVRSGTPLLKIIRNGTPL